MNHAAELTEEIASAISSMPDVRRARHGFQLFAEDAGPARRAHARTVLLAEHTLGWAAATHGSAVVLMKGLEVAQLYPDVLQRPFRDLDILVSRPQELWAAFVAEGYVQRASRRADIDHHHLPALSSPLGPLGVEVHVRPNVPGWARIDPSWVMATAEPSRTGVVGAFRPRDDVHALLLALHAWKGGFTRLRDVFDALLLASVSERPVERTADALGLGACWRWTIRFAETELIDRGSPIARVAARIVLPRDAGVAGRKRTRLIAPLLCRNPVAVTRSHVAEYRLARSARRKVDQGAVGAQ